MEHGAGDAFQNGREDSEQESERGECELQIAKQALHPYVISSLSLVTEARLGRELMGGHTAVDLAFMGLENTLPEDGEVFCPIAGPR